MNERNERCTYCIYYNRRNHYCSFLEDYVENTKEAIDCYGYRDSITLRVQDKYKDDYEDEDSYEDNEGRY